MNASSRTCFPDRGGGKRSCRLDGAADPPPLRSLFLFISQREGGDSTGTGDEDRPRKATEEEECPERAGGKKKEAKENLVFVTDFGEKISLFLPGFEEDAGETSSEPVRSSIRPGQGRRSSPFLSHISKVTETDGDGDDPSDGGSPSLLETEEGRLRESPGASKRCPDVCKQRSEAQIRRQEPPVTEAEEMERLRAKAAKKSDKEKRRQQEYQDGVREELRRQLMKPREVLSGNECRSEVERLKAQMRQQVEQLQPELDLELRAEEKEEEREQVRAAAVRSPAAGVNPLLLLLSGGDSTRRSCAGR